MDINELITIVKNKLLNQINIESIIPDKNMKPPARIAWE